MTSITITNATLTIDETMEFEYGTLLVAESADGTYEPVAVVSTIQEARFLADENMRHRMRDLEDGKTPMCPERYVVWELAWKEYRSSARSRSKKLSATWKSPSAWFPAAFPVCAG